MTTTSITSATRASTAGRAVPRLHVITPDRDDVATRSSTAALLAAGVPLLQVRRKGLTDRTYLAQLEATLARRPEPGSTMVLVDDRADLALAAGADGVHVGAEDLPVDVARALLGPGPLLGATARGAADARDAEADGADYLGVGPVYPSTTKVAGLPAPIGPEGLAEVVAAVRIPVIAIAGITAATLPEVLATGAHGVAVSAAVYDAADPVAAVTSMLDGLGASRPGASS